jgi:hypothetical protein
VRRWHRILLGFGVGAFTFVALVGLSATGLFDYDVWVRKHPLENAVAVTSVHGGVLTLADGRSLRPAGVVRRDVVNAADYDAALRAVVAQGIVVTRDLGDGRAFMIAEPRFYNWCGTRGYNGDPCGRCAGEYIRCPVSELLAQAAYARTVVDEPGLTARERWRLEGVGRVIAVAAEPTRMSGDRRSFRWGGGERELSGYDEYLELMWKPAPE